MNELLDETVGQLHQFAAPAGTDLDAFAAAFRAAWTQGNEWLPCHCGATRVQRFGECRDCTAVTAAGGAR